jgi:hypothetical protein
VRVAGPAARAARAAYVKRVVAAVAFWAVAVLFTANVSLLSGWLLTEVAAAESPAPTEAASEALPSPVPSASPSASPSPAEASPETVLLDATGTTITFPRPPATSDNVLEIAGVDTTAQQHVVTGDDGATYTVGVIEYPPQVDVSDPAVNLLASVSGAAGSAGGRVAEQDVTVYEGAPAVEFTLTTGAVDVQARYVLQGNRLYAASVTHTTGAEPTNAQAFLDSLDLADTP